MQDYTRLAIDSATPPKVAAFIRDVADLYIADVHAMLRLPLPDHGIHEACNFTIASALLGFVAGVSVELYKPSKPGNRGRLFIAVLEQCYPWDTEPSSGVQTGSTGAALLYEAFRNPLAHSLGRYDQHVRRISRPKGPGLDEQLLEVIERSTVRPPDWVLSNQPTLRLHGTVGVELFVEAFYWGVREMVRRLTGDAVRMSIAEAHL